MDQDIDLSKQKPSPIGFRQIHAIVVIENNTKYSVKYAKTKRDGAEEQH